MRDKEGKFHLRLATNEQDLLGTKRLRYKVFVEEMGGDGQGVDHTNKFEIDPFDEFTDHLVLVDTEVSETTLDHVVGSYRLLRGEVASENIGFYSSSEFDLSPIIQSKRKLLELGRSCIHPEYRGGSFMFQLWNGLASYVIENKIEILFGVASFHGTNINSFARPLSYLYHWHLAPKELLVRAIGKTASSMDITPINQVNRIDAVVQIPPLIKAYLRLGGFVGDGAFIDYQFNTIDVCVVMDTHQMSQSRKDYYEQANR